MKYYIDYDYFYDKLNRLLKRAEIEGKEYAAEAIKFFMELAQIYKIPLDKIK